MYKIYSHCRIIELRNEFGFNQIDVSKCLKIPKTTYFNYEIDKKIPFHIIVKMCFLYNTNPEYLLGFSNKRRNFIDENGIFSINTINYNYYIYLMNTKKKESDLINKACKNEIRKRKNMQKK